MAGQSSVCESFARSPDVKIGTAAKVNHSALCTSHEGVFKEGTPRLSKDRPVSEHIWPDRSTAGCLRGVDLPPSAA